MTPEEAILDHRKKIPEMPRPYRPDSEAAKTHQKELYAWIREMERLEMDLIPLTEPDAKGQPVCSRSEYTWVDIKTPRPKRPKWSGATKEYFREAQAKRRALIKLGLAERSGK